MLASSKCGYIANATAVQISVVPAPTRSAPIESAHRLPRPSSGQTPAGRLRRPVGDTDRDDVEATCPSDDLGRRGRPDPARRPRRLGAPITSRAAFLVRVFGSACAADGPSSVTVSASSDSASRRVDAPVALGRGQAQQVRRLDVNDRPLRIERVGQALAGPDELLGLAVGTDGDEHTVARHPRPRGRSVSIRRARPRRHDRRRAAARARAERSGSACGRTARRPSRPAPARRPCRHVAVR
jgi:hypothetical protein